ncbi:M23 family metallopeptidase [Thalassococcus sp. CAU 1522]|uniref:M23 family metallopeptidase n=1 Tax=Thalassococcus arenae TaxID=2851652 RepID=A0ABS6N6W9_9RHOB|nr:M23 family metallopeptidase [Thalassococcus arenae]MBV2359756.1 M23 family metallopeptidase [Thalassococcus arenae]
MLRTLLFTVLLGFPISVPADIACDNAGGQICVETQRDGDRVTLYGINRFTHLPVTLSIDLDLSNMQRADGAPGPFVLRGDSRVELMTLAPLRSGAWSYSYRFDWSMGDINARHDDRVLYRLPYANGRDFAIMQGCDGGFTHFGNDRYAVDFDMPVGTPVHAARSGRAVAVVESSDSGGPSRDFENDANYVVIEQDDGTLARYFHLQRNGAVVSPGDQIESGQLIGYSGNTGYSTDPHLHFDVVIGARGTVSQTIPVSFDTPGGAIQCPREGRRLRAVAR